MEFIDLKEQYRRYKAEIDERMQRVLDHCHFIMGPEIVELEQALRAYVDVEHCITVASGTDSLEIALRALDIGAGRRGHYRTLYLDQLRGGDRPCWCEPVFVDIEPATYNINVDSDRGSDHASHQGAAGR